MFSTGDASLASFSTTGGSVSLGNWPRMAETRSRISCAPTSPFFSSTKVTKTWETPSAEVERSSSIPLTVFTASSMRLVTWVSTSSGEAPRKVVVTVTVGKSTLGKKSTPKLW